MLAAGGSHVLWDWPTNSTTQLIAAETADEVDDLRVENSLGSRAFIQAKHRLQQSTSPTSPLGKSLRQFVAQSPYLQRDDRLVLATSSESSAPIREDLPRLLERIRSLGATAAVVESARNTRERATLETVTQHISSGWQEIRGEPPSEIELRTILSRIYLTTFDLYRDQSEVFSAQQMLRTVLVDPATSAAVWGQLVSLLAEQATLQAGFTLQSLESELATAGIGLRTSIDYRDDVNRLRAHSQTDSRRLANYQSIPGDDGSPIRVSRPLVHDLLQSLHDGPLVVTGEPGSGKSGALADLMELAGPEADFVILSADTLSSQSLGTLRTELGLNHDVVDVLAQWRGERQAYLIVDALDAGRGSGAQEMLLELVAAVMAGAPRWTIAVSVRRFDLRYGRTIQQVFRGSAASANPTFQLDEFANVRHFNIPELSPSELASIAIKAPRLGRAIDASPSSLTTLIANAFCLRLFAELVAANIDRDEMATIHTRAQLLDAYWNHRVLESAFSGDRRELLLRQICSRALDARTLTVGRADVLTDTNADVLNDLLAARVLTEAEEGGRIRRELIGFAHHVLFDYAVARVILRGQPELAVDALVREPDSLLFARPSYQMHFEYLWELDTNRCTFWSNALRLSSREDLPGIAKVIAPGVAARAASAMDDVQPLLTAIEGDDPGTVNCLQHVVGALLHDDAPGASIPPERQRMWSHFSATLAAFGRPDLVGTVRALLFELVSSVPADDATRTSIGNTGRLLLEWLWEAAIPNRYLLNVAIRAVTLGYDTAPLESAEVLRRIIDPERMPSNAYVEMPILTDEVLTVASVDAELARDIFVAAFEYKELSPDQTVMHSGVLNLSSTRRQDYESSHYNLGLHFPQFLEAHPREATEALARVRHEYSRRYGVEPDIFEVQWPQQVVRIVDDRRFWSPDEEGHDAEATLLAAFRSWLDTRDASSGGHSRLLQAIATVKEITTPAALWRSLLEVAENGSPVELREMVPMLNNPASLLADGTSISVGNLLHRRFSDLTAEQRRAIEFAIWNLPQDLEGRNAERASLIRDRLLGCVEPEQLVLDHSLRRRLALSESGRVPQNRRPSIEFEQSEFTDDDVLIDLGIDPTAPEISTVLTQIRPVDNFADTFLNTQPSCSQVEELVRVAGPLWASMTDPDLNLPAAILDRCWNALVRAARSSTRATDFATLAVGTIAMVEDWLVEASARDVEPEPAQDIVEFDRSPWFEGGVREYAAEGLLCVAHYDLASAAGIESIRALSTDASPGPRLMVVKNIRLVQQAHPDLMWEVITRGLRDESAAVTADTVFVMSHVLFRTDAPRLLQLLETTYQRAVTNGARMLLVREACLKVATDMFIWLGDLRADSLLVAALQKVGTDPKEAEAIGRQMRSPFGCADGDVRDRAFRLAARACNAATAKLEELIHHRELGASVDDELIRVIAQTIEHFSSDYYFASGAYARQQHSDDDPSPPSKADFYSSSIELVQSLFRAPYPSVIHYVLQTLDYLLEVDPREIFPIMAEGVVAGRRGNYEFDLQAASLMVSVVQRFIADHRATLLDDAQCRRSLLMMLNVFVEAGWPAARRLTYSLESIFR